MLQLIILSALVALCLAYPADDTQPNPNLQVPKQSIVGFEDASDDLVLAESAQWGRGGGGGRWGGGG